MGLDLLVLSLSRFLAGQYRGPVEDLAQRIGTPKPDAPEELARERVRRIREDLERRVGRPLDWTEEGEAALSVQYQYGALQALRAYAALQEYPLDGPGGAPSFDEKHPSLMKVYHQNAPTRYRHLIEHSDCDGFYVPCDFPDPLPCREILDAPARRESLWGRCFDWAFRTTALHGIALMTGTWKELRRELRAGKEESRLIRRLRRESPYPRRKEDPPPRVPRGKSLYDWGNVGSSIRLLAELDGLNERLRIRRDWGELGSGETAAPEGDPLGDVKYGWSVLHYAARVSVEKRLPLVLDG